MPKQRKRERFSPISFSIHCMLAKYSKNKGEKKTLLGVGQERLFLPLLGVQIYENIRVHLFIIPPLTIVDY